MTAVVTRYESLLKVRKGAVDIVDVPEFGFVAVTGTGEPGGAEFTEAVQALIMQPDPVDAELIAAATPEPARKGIQPPGQGRAGAALLAASVAGAALARLRCGGSAAAAACWWQPAAGRCSPGIPR